MKASPLPTLVLIFLLPCFLLVDLSSARGLGPRYTPDECGASHGNQSCPSDECCSTADHCGTDYAWCAPGHCQPEFGMCWDSVPPPPPSSSPPPPPSSSPPPPPPPSSPPPPPPSSPPPPPFSPYDCGPTHGNQTCPSGECCSTWDACGIDYNHCAPGYCQPEFGVCWDSVPPPPPATHALDDEADSLVRQVFEETEAFNF